MKDKILLYIICIFAIIGCNDDMPVVMPEDSNKVTQEHHGVPLKDALEQLEDFLITVDQPTRSGEVRRIGNIDVLRSRDITTRSVGAGATNIDSLIYIVNFEDNQGFAYLAADDRISAPIIFVADSGSASTMSFGDPLQIETRTIYPEYPTTGAGTFQIVNDTINEWFMNPNTFSLYDSSQNSFLVGDFFYGGEAEYEEFLAQVNNLVLNFIGIQIKTREYDSEFDGIGWEGYEEISDEPIIVKITTQKETTICVQNMLTFAKNWAQNKIFNNNFPEVREYLLWGNKKKALTGCVPLAIAKIMTYHGYPVNYSLGDNVIDWTSLRNSYLISPPVQRDAAALLYHIAESSGSMYFYSGTFTFPSLAALYLKGIGYKDVEYVDYNDDLVQTMLDNGCPVFVCSVPRYAFLNYDLAKSHGWNLDGYLICNKIITKEYYQGENLLDSINTPSTYMMVHCDWGWEGAYNGYFISGVFDLGSEDKILDENLVGDDVTNYNWYQKMIYYNI